MVVDVTTWECADAPSNNLPANVILTLSMQEVMDGYVCLPLTIWEFRASVDSNVAIQLSSLQKKQLAQHPVLSFTFL